MKKLSLIILFATFLFVSKASNPIFMDSLKVVRTDDTTYFLDV